MSTKIYFHVSRNKDDDELFDIDFWRVYPWWSYQGNKQTKIYRVSRDDLDYAVDSFCKDIPRQQNLQCNFYQLMHYT